MQKFEVGKSYGVLHMDDRVEAVTVIARSDESVTLSDGRVARVIHGIAPDGGSAEVLRLDERGPVAIGGIVRSCDVRSNCDKTGA